MLEYGWCICRLRCTSHPSAKHDEALERSEGADPTKASSAWRAGENRQANSAVNSTAIMLTSTSLFHQSKSAHRPLWTTYITFPITRHFKLILNLSRSPLLSTSSPSPLPLSFLPYRTLFRRINFSRLWGMLSHRAWRQGCERGEEGFRSYDLGCLV